MVQFFENLVIFLNFFLTIKGLTCDGGHKIAVPTCKIILCALNEKIVTLG